MVGLIAQRRWFIATITCVALFAALSAWALAPTHGWVIAALGAASVLALGAGALGFARAAAARRALAGDLETLSKAADAAREEAGYLRQTLMQTEQRLSQTEQRLSLAERRLAALAIKLDLSENDGQ